MRITTSKKPLMQKILAIINVELEMKEELKLCYEDFSFG